MKFLILLSSLLTFASAAWATKIVGNGGDTYALEFVAVADDVQKYLAADGAEGLDLEALKNAIATTKVESTDKKLSLHGLPKDAINYPAEKRIVFSRLRWTQISEMQKPAIVLHEYLGILGVADQSYKFSKALLGTFGYGKNVTEVTGPFTVNFATDQQYALRAHVLIENTGPESWHYNAAEEKIRIIVDHRGLRRVFVLPAQGRVISANSSTDGEDDGLMIRILQPVLNPKREPRILHENGSEYIPHIIREYRIKFTSPVKGTIPEGAEFEGPINNMAG
jgi:hypothetical protein